MIQPIVDRFMRAKPALREKFAEKLPTNYSDLLKIVVMSISDEDSYECDLDCNRIHKIDDGDYQGTLIFVIACLGYQPTRYWQTRVSYGSCSGCDTIQAIHEQYGEDGDPTTKQVDDMLLLALHMIERMKVME